LIPGPPENPINPWESSSDPRDESQVTATSQHYATPFSGDLDASMIANFFDSTTHIGCVVPLVLFSAIVWIAILSQGFGGFGITIVIVASVAVLLFIWNRYVGANHAKRLLKRRPWLTGKVHGVASSGRLTVWHNDFCFQSALQPYMFNLVRGMICFPEAESPYPWTMIPSTCFYHDQWWDLVEACEHRRIAEPKIVPATPADGWECLLDMNRSFELRNRSIALRWRPHQGIALLYIVLGIWISSFEYAIGFIGGVPLIPLQMLGAWILTEAARVLLAAFSVSRDFSDPDRQAYRRKTRGQTPQVQWFNQEQLLFTDVSYWILCPVRYIERVTLRSSWIEFRIGGESMLFHREGFVNEEAWQGACKDALAIKNRIRT